MSTPFYDLASMVVLPSGYKSGKIYAQKPLTTDGQLTFTRASTATRVNASGLIETVSSGVPRLDYTNSSCPKILLEPQRSNLIPYSNDAASWNSSKSGTFTANAAVSPDGTTNAFSQVAASSDPYAYHNLTLSTATYTFSCYLKGQGTAVGKYFSLRIGANTQNFIIGSTWQRYVYSVSVTAGSYNVGFEAPESAAVGETIFGYGFQLEEGAYVTSVIPTSGAAVTRLADYAYANQSPTANFGSGAFSVFFDIENVRNMSGNASDLTAFVGNRQSGTWWRFFGQPGPNVTQFEVQGANGYNAPVIGTFTQFANGRNKVAISRSATRFLCYVNGVEVINSTNAVYLSNFDSTNTRIELSDWNNGATHPTNAKFNQLLIFKGTALTAAQLAEITTL
jgi:hypothetical protein